MQLQRNDMCAACLVVKQIITHLLLAYIQLKNEHKPTLAKIYANANNLIQEMSTKLKHCGMLRKAAIAHETVCVVVFGITFFCVIIHYFKLDEFKMEMEQNIETVDNDHMCTQSYSTMKGLKVGSIFMIFDLIRIKQLL